MIVLGIDPGSKTCGLFMFNSETRDIHFAEAVHSRYADANMRVWHIGQQVHDLIQANTPADIVCIESTVMAGVGNTTYQKTVGAIISRMFRGDNVVMVSNMTMKKMVGGTGKAEKPEVAKGASSYFGATGNQRSFEVIEDLIEQELYDITDAAGVGIAGLKIYQEENNAKPKIKKAR